MGFPYTKADELHLIAGAVESTCYVLFTQRELEEVTLNWSQENATFYLRM